MTTTSAAQDVTARVTAEPGWLVALAFATRLVTDREL